MSEKVDIHSKTANFTTNCRDCIFAEFWTSYDSDGFEQGEFQSGCKLGRLDKLKKNEISDGYITSYVIDGICNACRPEEWGLGLKEKEQLDKIKKEIQVQLDFIIVDVDQKDEIQTQNDIVKSCKSALEQEVSPKSVVIISDNKNLKFASFADEKLNPLFENSGVKYQLIKHGENIPVFERLVDVASKRCLHTFFSIYKIGEEIPKDYVERVNTLLNTDLVKTVYIKTHKKYHDLFHSKLFKLAGGYKDGYIEDKIMHLAKKQNLEHMILEWKNIL